MNKIMKQRVAFLIETEQLSKKAAYDRARRELKAVNAIATAAGKGFLQRLLGR